jgi:hypothetical protein
MRNHALALEALIVGKVGIHDFVIVDRGDNSLYGIVVVHPYVRVAVEIILTVARSRILSES